jgi:hypothetical protein
MELAKIGYFTRARHGHCPFIDNTFGNTLATNLKRRREAVTIVNLLMYQHSAYSISKVVRLKRLPCFFLSETIFPSAGNRTDTAKKGPV